MRCASTKTRRCLVGLVGKKCRQKAERNVRMYSTASFVFVGKILRRDVADDIIKVKEQR